LWNANYWVSPNPVSNFNKLRGSLLGLCEFWGFHSSVIEDSILAVSLDNFFPNVSKEPSFSILKGEIFNKKLASWESPLVYVRSSINYSWHHLPTCLIRNLSEHFKYKYSLIITCIKFIKRTNNSLVRGLELIGLRLTETYQNTLYYS